MKKDKTDARKISQQELENRRRKAIALKSQGLKNSEISNIVGLAPQTISTLYTSFQKYGEIVVQPKKRGRSEREGRRIKQQEENIIIKKLLQTTPRDLGYESVLWTREAVQALISKEIDTSIPITTTGDYLKRWGISNKTNIVERKMNENRNTQENYLKRRIYQKFNDSKKKNEMILWIDIISVSKQNLKMLYVQTETRKSKFLLYEKTRRSNDILMDFMTKMINSSTNKVYLILVSNYRIEKKTKKWVEAHKNKIEIASPLHEEQKRINDYKRKNPDNVDIKAIFANRSHK